MPPLPLRFRSVWLPVALLTAALHGAALATPRPEALYGSSIEFDVYRNGSHVGLHTVRFGQDGGDLLVDSHFSLRIDVLFFTAYAFDYRSKARWRDGELAELTATVNENGDRLTVVAERHGREMRLSRPDGRETVAAPVLPTNHWNAAVLHESRVFNTLTGRINDVTIVAGDRETVPTELGPVPATRYAYTGDLTTEVWYDRAGRWVKMRFQGKDGSTIEYACRRCQGGSQIEAVN